MNQKKNIALVQRLVQGPLGFAFTQCPQILPYWASRIHEEQLSTCLTEEVQSHLNLWESSNPVSCMRSGNHTPSEKVQRSYCPYTRYKKARRKVPLVTDALASCLGAYSTPRMTVLRLKELRVLLHPRDSCS